MTISQRSLRGSLLLLVAAMIWGSAFVAQRFGAESMGPASFTAVRHALGTLVLLVVVAAFDGAARRTRTERASRWRAVLLPGLGVGVALSGGSLLQQAGLEFTTAGNAGFITGLYMVFIPVAGWLLFRQRAGRWTWLGVVLGLAGLYLLSVRDGVQINIGDLLVLGCAVFWTGHIMFLERLGHLDPFRLCVVQFATCAVVSLVVALVFEPAPLTGIVAAAVPLAYAALLSTGVGFTLAGRRPARRAGQPRGPDHGAGGRVRRDRRRDRARRTPRRAGDGGRRADADRGDRRPAGSHPQRAWAGRTATSRAGALTLP